MRTNRLRQLLNEDRPTAGTHLITPWPGMVEVIGRSGDFDYIEYVGEYSPFSLDLLDNLGRAIDLFPDLSAMMKVDEQNRGFITTRAIDAGLQNVLFTDCRSADDVRECIRLVRSETPTAGGTHGAGMRRVVGYGSYSDPASWSKAMDEVVIALMIEKKAAMENLDEILDVPGVDMVQFGPVDYAVSVGKPEAARSEEILAVQKEMIQRALEAGVHPRVEIASSEQAGPFLDLGVRHFCVGWDLVTVATFCRKQSKAMKELLGT